MGRGQWSKYSQARLEKMYRKTTGRMQNYITSLENSTRYADEVNRYTGDLNSENMKYKQLRKEEDRLVEEWNRLKNKDEKKYWREMRTIDRQIDEVIRDKRKIVSRGAELEKKLQDAQKGLRFDENQRKVALQNIAKMQRQQERIKRAIAKKSIKSSKKFTLE